MRSGIPVAARLLALAKAPTRIANGATSHFAVFARFEFRDPQTGEMSVTECQSRQFQTFDRGNYTTSFRVGDYVTAVYLPEKPRIPLKLLDFLDLFPDVGLVQRVDSIGIPLPRFTIPFLFGLMLLSVFVVVAAVTYRLYVPLDFRVPEAFPIFLTSFCAVAFVWVLAVRQYRRAWERRSAEWNSSAGAEGEPLEIEAPAGGTGRKFAEFLLFVAVAAIGGLAILYTTYAINAVCDSTPARMQKVAILGYEVAEHHGVFRTHTIEFMIPGRQESRLCTSPQQIAEFERAAIKDGIAEIHSGFLGWRWVKSIRPDFRPAGK
jgi:hypothetical protein